MDRFTEFVTRSRNCTKHLQPEYVKALEDGLVPEYVKALDQDKGGETPLELLDEAGNISSAVAVKIQNDVIKFGKNALKAKDIDDKLDYLARQNGALSGLVLMSIAVSGDDSFIGKLSKGLSLRKV